MNINDTKVAIKKIARIALKPLSPLNNRLSPGNFAIFHLGRCGSAVLGQLLKQHNHIYWGSEIYSPIFSKWQKDNLGVEKIGNMPKDAIKILRNDMLLALTRHYGFAIKPFHFPLISYTLVSYLKHLDDLKYNKFIVLDRKNRLRKIVSSIIMHQYQIGHIGKNTLAKRKKIYINIDSVKIDFENKRLIEYLIDYDKQFEELKSKLADRNTIILTYEEDIESDPKQAYNRICEFLKLDPASVKVKFAKTNPFAVQEMIENFEDLEKVLRGTSYEWMLYK